MVRSKRTNGWGLSYDREMPKKAEQEAVSEEVFQVSLVMLDSY